MTDSDTYTIETFTQFHEASYYAARETFNRVDVPDHTDRTNDHKIRATYDAPEEYWCRMPVAVVRATMSALGLRGYDIDALIDRLQDEMNTRVAEEDHEEQTTLEEFLQ
jgi:hypothetical protein